MMNILNGGAHAKNGLDVQEFMILPVGASSFREAMQMGCEITLLLGRILHGRGLFTGVGDEGGFAPALSSEKEALDLVREAIGESKYGEDRVKIALDAAASEWVDGKVYRLPKSGRVFTSSELADYWRHLVEAYPIVSLEDGLGEEDWEGWRRLTEGIAPRLAVGDDLFGTNAHRFARGVEKGAGNAILIKPNQIGTVSETARVIRMAKSAGYRVILSHRSGETEDTSLADLAVGFEADFIKAGAPCRSERVAKYNRLLGIERQMRGAEYGGEEKAAFSLTAERIPL
jgi:enolase